MSTGQKTEPYFVDFDTIGREFRCKFSTENGNASLKSLQGIFEKYLSCLKSIKGVKSVKRVVCGGCHDFKIIVEISADCYDAWSKAKHAPEADVISSFKTVEGVSSVETQTYTFMSF